MTDAKKRGRAAQEDTATLDLFADTAAGGAGGSGGSAVPAAVASGDDFIDMATFAERSYLTYAMSVVRGRAIPNVEDGQKPVQRRILYAMHELGLRAGVQHSKSARIVGEVLGKYHPHGDASTYDALVRMAQNFSLRYPLIDGQGNFGTADGDSAAAYRYTEARLTPIAELLLSEIEQDTVDFAPNYDGAFKEPKLLPARLPMLLANGASGIGVGMATDVPPHNLREVARAVVATIRKPAIGIGELLRMIPGPDLPGGGQIISSGDDIRGVYESGRGSLRVRARWTLEELARGQWRIAVNELPFGVSARAVLEDIERATNPKPREGKKSLTQDQVNLKTLMLSALDTVRDESDKSSPVRLVFEPRSSRQIPQEFVDLLLANTRLETTLPVNLVMLGRDGRPRSKNLKQAIDEWIAFRFATVTRRTKHRLAKVDRRIHILEGRLKALLSIDKVIRIIRKADDPKADLMAAFALTEIQADDILEIRLRQLARLEGVRIESELKELNAERKGLKRILADERALSELIVGEIEADAAKYGDARRTLIEAAAPPALTRTVPDEPATITLSRNGWIRSRQGHGLDATQFTYKAGDSALAVMETRTVNPIVVLDTRGRAYTIRASDVPGGRGDGVPVTTLIELQSGANVAQAIAGEPASRYLVTGSGGYGFIATFEDMVSRVKAGKAFMTLEADEAPLCPVPLPERLDHVAALSEKGKLLVFALDEMRAMERGRGVMVMRLDDDDRLAAVAPVAADRIVLRGTHRGKEATLAIEGEELAKHRLHRARKGYLLARRFKPSGFT